jgi:hypothetical protein
MADKGRKIGFCYYCTGCQEWSVLYPSALEADGAAQNHQVKCGNKTIQAVVDKL